MGIKSRAFQKRTEDVGTPPDSLNENEIICTVVKPRGNSLYEVLIPKSEAIKLQKALSTETQYPIDSDDDRTILVSMPPKFRNTIFIKRGGHIVIELYNHDVLHGETESKVKGDINNIIINKKDWQRYPYWPIEYKEVQKDDWGISSEEEEEDEEEDDDDDDEGEEEHHV